MLNVNSKTPVIQLLRIAKNTGAICDWTVDGYYVVLHRDSSKLRVFLADAGSLLSGMLSQPRSAVACVAEV